MNFINNTPFIFFHEGWGICGCGKSLELHKIHSHMSELFPGFCVNGIRIGKKLPYQCICGRDFTNDEDSADHVDITDFKCIKNAIKLDSRECKICGLDFNGPVQLKRHESTKRHIRKIEKPLHCKICDIDCHSKTTYETHLQTKKHLARVEAPPLDLECKLCKIKCLSQNQMKAHLQTKKHAKWIQSSSSESPLEVL